MSNGGVCHSGALNRRSCRNGSIQGSFSPPESALLRAYCWSRIVLRIAFSIRRVCLPGEVARWIAQSDHAALRAVGAMPPVPRARKALSARSVISLRKELSNSSCSSPVVSVFKSLLRTSLFIGCLILSVTVPQADPSCPIQQNLEARKASGARRRQSKAGASGVEHRFYGIRASFFCRDRGARRRCCIRHWCSFLGSGSPARWIYG